MVFALAGDSTTTRYPPAAAFLARAGAGVSPSGPAAAAAARFGAAFAPPFAIRARFGAPSAFVASPAVPLLARAIPSPQIRRRK